MRPLRPIGTAAGWLVASCLTASVAAAGSEPPPAPTFATLAAQVAAAYDSARGGFVARNGTPDEGALELALRLAREPEGEVWRARALATLGWMRALQDTLSGGFATRAAVSSADGSALGMRAAVNARRLEHLLRAAELDEAGPWRRDAQRLATYMDRVLLDGRGGFVAGSVGDRELEPAANGVAIHAWLALAAARRDPALRDFALRSLDRVWEACWDEMGVLLRRGTFGEVLEPPQLVDQVEMGRALIAAARLAGRPRDATRARAMGEVLLAKFEQGARPGFLTEAMPKADGRIRGAAREADENARAARFLRELAALTGEASFAAGAARAESAFVRVRARAGLEAGEWALALRPPAGPAGPVDWQAAAVPALPPPVLRFRTRR